MCGHQPDYVYGCGGTIRRFAHCALCNEHISMLSCTMQIFEYNGSAIVAMAGEQCFAIGSDLRFGVQFQTLATDYKKVYKVSMHR